jgi:hypothetical protein
MARVDHTSQFVAGRHIGCVASLLNLAECHLRAARCATYRNCRERLYPLTQDLRFIGSPQGQISSALKSECDR